jgi:hypothetical protein
MSQYLAPNQIIEVGYGQPGRFVFTKTQLPYSGPYHKDFLNRFWEGETHTLKSKELDEIESLNSNNDLNTISKNTAVTYKYSKLYQGELDTPFYTFDHILPTFEDYFNGFFNRYIIQLKSSAISELNIIEINKENYDKLIANNNALKSYNIATIPWVLSGPIFDYIDENNVRIDGVYNTNLRFIRQAEKIIKNLSLYLTDPLQFVNTSNKAF